MKQRKARAAALANKTGLVFFVEENLKKRMMETEVCPLFLWVRVERVGGCARWSRVEMRVGGRVGCGVTVWRGVGWGWRVSAVDGRVGAVREVKRRVGVGCGVTCREVWGGGVR